MDITFLFVAVRQLFLHSKIKGKEWECSPFSYNQTTVWLHKRGDSYFLMCWDNSLHIGGDHIEILLSKYINKEYMRIRGSHVYGRAVAEITGEGLKRVRKDLRKYVKSEELRVMESLNANPFVNRLNYLIDRHKEKADKLLGKSQITLIYKR